MLVERIKLNDEIKAFWDKEGVKEAWAEAFKDGPIVRKPWTYRQNVGYYLNKERNILYVRPVHIMPDWGKTLIYALAYKEQFIVIETINNYALAVDENSPEYKTEDQLFDIKSIPKNLEADYMEIRACIEEFLDYLEDFFKIYNAKFLLNN